MFDIDLSILKEVLKRSSELIKCTVGRGRGAVTQLTSRFMMFKSLLVSRQNYLQQVQLTFAELLPEAKKRPSTLIFPSLESKLMTVELDILYRSGASPPGRKSS